MKIDNYYETLNFKTIFKKEAKAIRVNILDKRIHLNQTKNNDRFRVSK